MINQNNGRGKVVDKISHLIATLRIWLAELEDVQQVKTDW